MLGWHGEKRMWKIKKMEEIDALDVTIQRLYKNFTQNKGMP